VLTPYAIAGAEGKGVYNTHVEALSENMNSLNRSLADYVVMTNCSTIYNIDFEDLVRYHIERKADITAVYTNNSPGQSLPVNDTVSYEVSESGRITDIRIFSDHRDRRADDYRTNKDEQRNCTSGCGMEIFVIKKSLLVSLVADAMAYGRFDFHKDIMQRLSGSLNIQGYEYKKFYMNIDTIGSYMHANLNLIDIGIRNKVFENVVYTKVKDSVPTEYIDGCSVKNSIVSDGCRIEGTIENSVISRGVRLAKGSVVRNSIIMQNTTIYENVELNYVILDKDVIVREGRNLSGHESFPVVIAKENIV
jgi:glucose-1-phosphate adenylyltransferase